MIKTVQFGLCLWPGSATPAFAQLLLYISSHHLLSIWAVLHMQF